MNVYFLFFSGGIGAAEVFHFFMPYVCTQVSSCLLSVKTPPPTSQPQPPPPVTLYERCL